MVDYNNHTGLAPIIPDDNTDGSLKVKGQDTLHHTPVQVHQPQVNGTDRNEAITAHEATVAKALADTTDQIKDIMVILKARDVRTMEKAKDNTQVIQVHKQEVDRNIRKGHEETKVKDTGGEKEKVKEKHILQLLRQKLT